MSDQPTSQRTGIIHVVGIGADGWDGLSPRALEILSNLGVTLSTPPSIARLVLRSYRNPDVRAELSCSAPWGASRRLDLDERIAEAAVAAGAVLRTGALVESLVVEDGAVRGVRTRSSRGGQQILRAPVTLLAEGAVGALARQAPLSPPPGRQIAFATDRWGGLEIAVMQADGSDVRRLTDARGLDDYPSWSPDGQRIAFVTNRDGNYEVYVMAADGGEPVNVSQSPGTDTFPSWTPDGRGVTLVSQRDEGFDIYVVDLP